VSFRRPVADSTLKTVIKRLQLIKRDDVGKIRPFIFLAKRPAAATDAGQTTLNNEQTRKKRLEVKFKNDRTKNSVQVDLRLPLKINTGNKKVTTGHFCTIQVFSGFYFILIFSLEIFFGLFFRGTQLSRNPPRAPRTPGPLVGLILRLKFFY